MPHYYMKTTCATHGGKTTPSSKERRQKERRRIKKKTSNSVKSWSWCQQVRGWGLRMKHSTPLSNLITIILRCFFFSYSLLTKIFQLQCFIERVSGYVGPWFLFKNNHYSSIFKKKHVSQFKITVYLQIYTPRFLPFCHLNLQKELFVGLLRYSSDRGPKVRRHWFWRCRLWRIWEIENQLLLAEFKPDLGLTGFGFKPLLSWTSFIYLDQIFF